MWLKALFDIANVVFADDNMNFTDSSSFFALEKLYDSNFTDEWMDLQ